jgi:hypothetical protein
VTAVVSPTMASAQAADRDPNALEAQFIASVNALRTSQGLAPFIVDAEIRTVAMGWTEKMAAAGSISHNPNLAREITASWRKLGENVGTGPDVPSVEEAFENSPGHRRNLLDPDFTHVSITVVVRGDRIFVTQQFRTPSAPVAPATPTGAPTELALAVAPKPVAAATKSAGSHLPGLTHDASGRSGGVPPPGWRPRPGRAAIGCGFARTALRSVTEERRSSYTRFP